MMPYTTVASQKFGLSTDTCYSMDNLHSKTYAMRAGILMYCVDDNVWWNMNVAAGAKNNTATVSGDATGILPAPFQFSTGVTSTSLGEASYNADTHVVFLTRNDRATSHIMNSANEMLIIRPTDPTEPSLSSGHYGDHLWGSTTSGEISGYIPTVAGIGFSTVDFGTMARKRISRVEAVFAEPPWQDTSTFDSSYPYFNGSYSMSLFYDRLNHHQSNTLNNTWTIERTAQARGYGLSTNANQTSLNAYGYPDRYYWNNLGMGRYWNFFIMSSSYDPFPLEALEITVTQGTS
jgi:hypothetical protein